MGTEDIEGAAIDELGEGLFAGWDNGLHEAHHGLPLVAVQRIPHEHQPLPSQPLQQQPRIEPSFIQSSIIHSVSPITTQSN